MTPSGRSSPPHEVRCIPSEVLIGTTQGGSDILTWTSVGNVTSYTPSTGFTLIDGTAYYPSVRAIKTTNLTSTAANGNEFAVVTDTATLNLNFMTGTLPVQVQFSRASGTNVSAGTYYNSSGVLTTAAENFLLESQNFNTTWTSGSLITPFTSTYAAPDGTSTASFVTETLDSVNASHYVRQTVSPLVEAQPWTFSVYAKSSNRDIEAVLFSGSNANNKIVATFALSGAGSTSLVNEYGTASAVTASIQALSNGWYRCVLSGQPDTSGTGLSAYIYLSNGTSVGYTGDGVSGAYLWGAQLEQGSSASSYIYTTTTAAYGPRFDYNPSTLALNGLLIEESRTNMATNSGNIDSWNLTGASSSQANAASAPDGTITATKLIEDATTNYHYTYETFSLANATAYTCSFFAKAAQRNFVRVSLNNSAFSSSATGDFNLSSGTVISTSSVATSGILALPNGWYRIWVSGTTTSAATGGCVLFMEYPSGTYNYTGDGASGIYVWGGQMEAGAFPTSYIPTTTAAQSRSADVASVNSTSWLGASQGTLIASAMSGYLFFNSTVDATYVPTIAVSLEEDTNDRLMLRRNGSTSTTSDGYIYGLYYSGGNVEVADTGSAGSWPMLTLETLAIGYQANNYVAAASGSILGTSSTGTVFTPNQLVLGHSAYYGNYWNGWLQSVNYYDTRLTNAQIQQLSQP